MGIPDLGGHKVTGSISIGGAGGFESLQPKTLETIQDALSRAFVSSMENGVDSHFDISIKNDVNIQFRESVLPTIGMDDVKILGAIDSMDQVVPKVEIPNYSGGGIIGSGLISIEDAQLMKDFLSSEEFKNHMSHIGKSFVAAPKDIAIETKDLAKNIFEYGMQPSELKILKAFEVIGALSEFNAKYTAKEKLKIIGGAAWRELVNSVTNPEEQGQFLAEITIGLGMPRVVKGVKAVEKIIDEVIEFGKKDRLIEVVEREICPKEIGLFNDWGNVKQQSLRSNIPEGKLRNMIEYDKFKNELLKEVHIGHGNLHLLVENALSIQDLEKFGGQMINDLIDDKSLKNILNNWGISKDGTNQFLEHTIGKNYNRILEMAERGGINPTEFINIFSNDAVKKIQAMKNFDRISDEMIKKSTIKNLNLKGGQQEAYYIPSFANSEKGIIILKYNGKKNTMMVGDRKYFNNNFERKSP